MTEAQKIVQGIMEKKHKSVNWDEVKFKIENDKDIYFRFAPDLNKNNPLFFLSYRMYKLSEKIYVNYPDGDNLVQKTLKNLWDTGSSIAESVYRDMKGKEQWNCGILLCDKDGDVVDEKAKILTVTSKNLWNEIVSLYFKEDWIENPTSYLKVRRTGLKLETKYTVEKLEGEEISFADFELINLALPLSFNKSDEKAIEPIKELIKRFALPTVEDVKIKEALGF